jgi:multidrug efflux pump subunit AcrA (membrane-fusion protein)
MEPLLAAAAAGRKLTAIWNAGGERVTTRKLEIVYLDNEVDPQSRTYRFYASLPNELAYSSTAADARRYVTWRFKPGQRLQLEIPVEKLEKQIVLPLDALVQEGAEWFVFQPDGNRFVRRAVRVLDRNQSSAAIAQDGSLFPGEPIVLAGAAPLQLALAARAVPADPHAGHSH